MNLRHLFRLLPIVCLFLPTVSIASDGPDDRAITDPKSVNSETNASARPAPIGDLYNTHGVYGTAWSPDGKWISFTTDLGGRPNLWKVNSSGGWPVQLTQSDDRQYGGTWSPDGKWIVYEQDNAGNEMWDLYAVPSDGGEIINLTNTPDIREFGARWSHDGKTIALMYKPKEGTSYDIAVLDWATRKVRKVTDEKQAGYSWSAFAWSADDKFIYATRVDPPFTDADIYRIEVAGGKAENLTAHKGTGRYMGSSLSPDGTRILMTSDAKNGYMNVALLDLATKKITWVTNTKWEANSGGFTPNGKTFSYVVNEDGVADAFLVDSATNAPRKVSLPHGLNFFTGNPSEFSPGSNRVMLSHEASNQPGDIWVYDLGTNKAAQLTYSAVASLRATPLPASQLVHFKSFDGKIITALLWMPFNLKRDGSNPALVLPHGGPTGQMIDYWNTDVAALVSRGYICIAPNPRGSTGYGLDFQKANFQDLGGGDLKDEIAGVEFLKATGYVDPKKIGITGGSYGGFMTLMAIGKTPEIWAAAVEEFGIINWKSMLKSSDPSLNEYLKALLGDPEKNQKIYEEDSPITYIRQSKAPLLVLQGDNDPRVPKEEAQQVVDILKKEGRVVDAHYYPNEGHGFVKRENQIDAIRRTIDWFDQHLKGKTAAGASTGQ
jgi:dipeptidyl aminopeptidase/acylaminoacyl peptidase